ncbi:MAG: hypothetical protein ACE5G2_04075 [Candidatus Krumholzibacteriia bacterium]
MNAAPLGIATGGITGAEFRVEGAPSGWFFFPTANPESSIAFGDLLGFGTNIAFPSCQSTPSVNLYTVIVIRVSAVNDRLLSVLPLQVFGCPDLCCVLLTVCDAPIFTKICVVGGEALINGTGDPCTVAVEQTTWSTLKSLYN